MSIATLNHFASFKLTDAFWALESSARRDLLDRWFSSLRSAAKRIELYQVFPTRPEADIMAWSSLEAGASEVPREFFRRFARATSPHRAYLAVESTLWGLTKPSIYSRGKSDQEIDPFGDHRMTYFIAYPFSKTADWYLKSRDTRQGMMNEHIRVGHQYKEIHQLLIYSFGLQDQEFVVTYETEDLGRFSELVHELRTTEGRIYTERDTPITTAIHGTPDEILGLWC